MTAPRDVLDYLEDIADAMDAATAVAGNIVPSEPAGFRPIPAGGKGGAGVAEAVE